MTRWLRNQWDRAVAVVAAVWGAIALLVGWIGASGTVYPAQQIPFLISGGLFGMVMILFAATMWISADLRDEWRKLDELQRAVTGADLATASDPAASHAAPREHRAAREPLSAVR